MRPNFEVNAILSGIYNSVGLVVLLLVGFKRLLPAGVKINTAALKPSPKHRFLFIFFFFNFINTIGSFLFRVCLFRDET